MHNRFKCLSCLFVLFLAISSFAATTGKIVGYVTDAETGDPLIGVNVVLEGTSMGGSADLNGKYFIINIPPGIYSLNFTMMGYTTYRIENVRVRFDMTVTIDAKMSPTVINADESITIVAERALVESHVTGSISSVGADEIENLPVQEVQDVLSIQAGVVESDDDEIHIRGGRGGEVSYWIDGVSVTSLDGNQGVSVENSAIQEMQLVSGTFNAEYGKAMSGIVKIVTKEGGDHYTGQLTVFGGDYISNNKIYETMTDYVNVADPNSGNTVKKAVTENPVWNRLNPEFDLAGSLSGPVPLINDKLAFFINGRYNKSDGYIYGRKFFTPQGLPGDGSLVPINPQNKYSGQAKLTFKPRNDIKVNYNMFLNRSEFKRGTTGSAARLLRYVPDAYPQAYSKSLTQMLTLTHTLSPTTYYDFKIGHHASDFEEYLYKDPNKMPNYLIQITKEDGSVEYTDFNSNEEKEAIINEVNENELWSYDFVLDPDNSVGYLHPDSNSVSRAQASFENQQTNLNHEYNSDNFWVAKLDLISQVTSTHQLQSGFEFQMHEYARDHIQLRPGTDLMGNEIVPFVPTIEPTSSIWHNKYNHKPKEMSFYLQDKMEFDDSFIMNLGIRFDYFDPDAVMPTDPSDPDIYNPSPYGNNKYKSDGSEYTVDERRALMHTNVKAKTQISPRLGVAYPISEKGVIHFSYGHFFQMPNAQYLYSRPDFKLALGVDDVLFGNPDLEAEKTVQYELGLQQQLGENSALNLTMFYKDIRDWVGVSTLIESQIPDTKYRQYENKDYSNVRGITIAVEKRYSNNYSASLDYSFSIAEGTYSSPGEAFSSVSLGEEPAKQLVFMDYDKRHVLNGVFSFRAKGWVVSLIGKFNSGFPYTPTVQAGNAAANYRGWQENIARRPATSSVDIYLNKELFRINNYKHLVFLRVYNLFDQKGALQVYTDTGSPDFDTNTTHGFIPYDADRVGSLEHYLLRPSWYQAPRQIQIGYTFEF